MHHRKVWNSFFDKNLRKLNYLHFEIIGQPSSSDLFVLQSKVLVVIKLLYDLYVRYNQWRNFVTQNTKLKLFLSILYTVLLLFTEPDTQTHTHTQTNCIENITSPRFCEGVITKQMFPVTQKEEYPNSEPPTPHPQSTLTETLRYFFLFFYYTSTKLWRGYIFAAVCVYVLLCMWTKFQ